MCLLTVAHYTLTDITEPHQHYFIPSHIARCWATLHRTRVFLLDVFPRHHASYYNLDITELAINLVMVRVRVSKFVFFYSRHVTSHPSELILAIRSWVGAMSTSQRVESKGRYGLCRWQVKLCDSFVTNGPYLSALEMNCCINSRYFSLLILSCAVKQCVKRV